MQNKKYPAMKKILSILSAAALVLLAGSCIQEQLTTFDNQVDADAPVLGSCTLGTKSLVFDYTPAVFHQDFNTKMSTYYSVVLTSVDGKPVSKTLPASVDENTVTLSYSSLSKVLMDMGYAEGSSPNVTVALRASIQPNTYDASVFSYVQSEDYTLGGIIVSAPAGSPYPEYTDDSDWSVTGSLSAYGIDWNKDLQMWSTPDGSKHVAKAVTLKSGDEFKFRKDQSWTDNYGGDFGGMDANFGVTGGGPNIVVGADGVYDLWLDTDAHTASVTAAYLPYPAHNEVSDWGVTGSLSAYGIDWNKDLVMYTDGTTHVAMNVTLGENDEFKYRKDGGWTENFGGDFGGLDADFGVTGGGPNIKVGAAGTYDLILDPEAKTARVVETLGGGFSAIIGGEEEGGEEDEPEDDVVDEAWAVIGAVNGTAWNKDFYMTNDDGLWTSPVFSAEADAEFKLRFDNTWDYEDCIIGAAENDFYATVGTAFTGAQPGNNIKIKDAGDYYVTLNESTLEITLYSMANNYSLIGNVNGSAWDKDFYMTESEGIWTSEEVTIAGEFKIRFNKSWADPDVYGLPDGAKTKLNEAFATAQPGSNFKLDEGKYTVKFDPAKKEITIIPSKPTNVWSVIGGVNGTTWSEDFYMTEVYPGIWISDALELEGEWKIRFNNDWGVNRGGASLAAIGEFGEASQDGSNITLTGKTKVVYNANNETIGTLGWSIIGTVASIEDFSWNKDIPMNFASDGKWYSIFPVALADGDEIKLRYLADWGVNRGGSAAAADEAFSVAQEGANFKAPAAGTYQVVYDPATETVTLSTDFWGLCGAFNEWGADVFMMALGNGKWAAYNQAISGEWKIRKGAGWNGDFGGTFAASGEAFEAVSGGGNINAGSLTGLDIVLDTEAKTITVTGKE